MVSQTGFPDFDRLEQAAVELLRTLGIVVTPIAIAAAIWLLLD